MWHLLVMPDSCSDLLIFIISYLLLISCSLILLSGKILILSFNPCIRCFSFFYHNCDFKEFFVFIWYLLYCLLFFSPYKWNNFTFQRLIKKFSSALHSVHFNFVFSFEGGEYHFMLEAFLKYLAIFAIYIWEWGTKIHRTHKIKNVAVSSWDHWMSVLVAFSLESTSLFLESIALAPAFWEPKDGRWRRKLGISLFWMLTFIKSPWL